MAMKTAKIMAPRPALSNEEENCLQVAEFSVRIISSAVGGQESGLASRGGGNSASRST